MRPIRNLAIGIIALYSASTFAQTFPEIPMVVRGNVSGAVVIGNNLEARVSSETVGSATAREDLTYFMMINTDNPITPEDEGAVNGESVEFYNTTNGKKAGETLNFESGGIAQQNLTFPEDTPTPTNTPTYTPKPLTNTPTDTPSPTDTPLPTNTYTETPTDTPKPLTNTPTDTPSPTDTPLPTNTYTETPTDTPKPPTYTPTPTETDTPTYTPTDTPKPLTNTPTDTPEPTITPIPTNTYTETPLPNTPTYTPTDTPKPTETKTPTPEYNTDLNQDGITDEKDLILLLNDWKTADKEDKRQTLFRFIDDWYR